ncbi:hypothetical protein NDU88_000987 [Pleurodeles waltl]|uniref:Uncharacterized protein n=1 Tax=Pleurodeles waltl TaxID=8319 RepID=A0AAV7V8S1_PLEWA|nr:hypothetical protein NDU88_000987 [Pleurodeles waltl]
MGPQADARPTSRLSVLRDLHRARKYCGSRCRLRSKHSRAAPGKMVQAAREAREEAAPNPAVGRVLAAD